MSLRKSLRIKNLDVLIRHGLADKPKGDKGAFLNGLIMAKSILEDQKFVPFNGDKNILPDVKKMAYTLPGQIGKPLGNAPAKPPEKAKADKESLLSKAAGALGLGKDKDEAKPDEFPGVTEGNPSEADK